jgi:hypothetical protein
MCINFFSFFILSSLSSFFFVLLFSFSFSFSLRCSLSLSLSLYSALSPSVSSQQLDGGGYGLSTTQWRWLWVGGCSVMGWWLFLDLLVMVVRGGDGVSGSDFSPPSRPWLQTKWVVVGLGLPTWVWWLWVWVCPRGCGSYGQLLLISLLRLWLIDCRGFGWGVKNIYKKRIIL